MTEKSKENFKIILKNNTIGPNSRKAQESTKNILKIILVPQSTPKNLLK